MRRGVAVLFVVAAACSTPAQTRRNAHTTAQVTGALGGVSLLVTGTAFLVLATQGLCGDAGGTCDDPAGPGFFYASASISAALLLTAVGAMVVHASIPEPAPLPPAPRLPTDAERAERERIERERAPINDRWHAFELLKLATRAAREGDCPTAIGLADRISTLSTHVYDGWFVHDEAIKRCLDAATAPATLAPPEADSP
jgi:hypothetical protein